MDKIVAYVDSLVNETSVQAEADFINTINTIRLNVSDE